MAPSSIHIGFGAVFATVALYAGWKFISYKQTMAEYRRATTRKPKIAEKELVSLLADVAKGSAAAVEAVENALKLPGTPAEELAEFEKSARAQIQKDLEALQRNALAERGFTESDVDHALTFYTKGSGRSKQVSDGVGKVKKAVGRYMLTKSRILEVMSGTFELQARLTQELVEKAVNEGRVSSMQELQMFMSRPVTAMKLQQEVERYSIDETGLTVQEIDAITNKPEYKDDAAFVDALTRVAEQGQEILGQAQQRIAAMLGGGGGGMMGMMGE